MTAAYVKTTRLSLFDGIELKEAVFRNHTFPSHFHDTYCIRLMEQGLELQQVENGILSVHAGAVLILNPNEVHANRHYDNDWWKYRTIFVNGDVVRHVQKLNGNNHEPGIMFTNHIIDNHFLFDSILAFHNSGMAFQQELLYGIVGYLVRNYRSDKKVLPVSNDLINDACCFLQANFSKKITVSDLAAKYKMNKFNFIRVFKNHTGLTPVSFLILHRVVQAKKLIAANLPMTSVAFDAGFYDQSHFNHYFKKYIGVAPLVYKTGCLVL